VPDVTGYSQVGEPFRVKVRLNNLTARDLLIFKLAKIAWSLTDV